jgi:hypothetical protein
LAFLASIAVNTNTGDVFFVDRRLDRHHILFVVEDEREVVRVYDTQSDNPRLEWTGATRIPRPAKGERVVRILVEPF